MRLMILVYRNSKVCLVFFLFIELDERPKTKIFEQREGLNFPFVSSFKTTAFKHFIYYVTLVHVNLPVERLHLQALLHDTNLKLGLRKTIWQRHLCFTVWYSWFERYPCGDFYVTYCNIIQTDSSDI